MDRLGRRGERRCAAVVAMAVAVLTMGACYRQSTDRHVDISYDQVANFSSYHVNQDDPPVKRQGELFIMYRITKITNRGLAAIPFTMGPDKIVVIPPIKDNGDRPSNESPDAVRQLLGDKLADNAQVPPGKVANNPGCIIRILHSASANVLTEALVPLSYENDPNEQPFQKVKMHREPSDNVTTAVSQGTPVALRGLC